MVNLLRFFEQRGDVHHRDALVVETPDEHDGLVVGQPLGTLLLARRRSGETASAPILQVQKGEVACLASDEIEQ